MWVSTLEIKNIKSFADSGTIDLSRNINILLGANNSGKSILIKALLMLQDNNAIQVTDVRVGENEGSLSLILKDIPNDQLFNNMNMGHFDHASDGKVDIKIRYVDGNINNAQKQYTLLLGEKSQSANGIALVSNTEPKNLIYPFLSKRKVVAYAEQVSKGNVVMVNGNLGNIVPKIDRVSNPQHPAYETYRSACEAILGFFVSTFASTNGKQAGLVVGDYEAVALEAMGEGVANILGIIVDLCMANKKLFLIEELENDIHPKSLKRLLDLIAEKSQNNQFVISTHSNIIARYLGAVPESKVFQISMPVYSAENRIPISTCREAKTTKERRGVLEVLGYELEDYELAKAWLFFEESSAEKIVRDFLIPWFTPKLRGRIQTVAAQGTSDVEPRFKDFNRLFVYLHLEEVYKNCAWVIVDGERSGQNVIRELKEKYVPNGWNEDHFIALSQDDFELYYPSMFREEAIKALSIENKKKKEAKGQLFDKVLNWIASNEQDAREEFGKSASDVIGILHAIEYKLLL